MYDQPLPIFEEVAAEEFGKRFTYKPDYLVNKKPLVKTKVDTAIATAEKHYRKKEFFSAEFEFNKALRLDEENVRANFGIGKVYLETGDIEKAREVFGKLAHIEAVFEASNKHIFNDLGIELRRLNLYDQAIDFYIKALTFTRDDENLYFNAARACYEKGDYKNARLFLGKTFTIDPKHENARRLLLTIEKTDAGEG
jgi:tetratricopeptide (TPR) repeat protein